jgi:hypothetical protein
VLDLYHLDQTLANEELFSSLYNETVEWGIYKPDLYFGTKNRHPHSLTVGMFWYIPANETNSNRTTRYAYQMDNGVIAYYEFNDATCSSR